ncbi:hypothetical protein BDN72DRAFT_774279 [Pluteus cervinus]|uniref:Uncharacterized protein n=1 Tax=Pluteus cervinus TaxID=181527 RepID=A0ACD3AGH1_9AGAR|nr:hypothetical protein BDN72DRAFT_774279 [Pluteus cervinus]
MDAGGGGGGGGEDFEADDAGDDGPINGEFTGEDIRFAKLFTVEFPNENAGAPIDPPDGDSEHSENADDNPWAPFNSQLEWEIAKWAKLRRQGSTAFSDLLAIPGVRERLGLSYSNSRELNKIIDDELTSRRPRFQRTEVVVQNEVCELYYRDIIECIRSLWADKDLTPHLIFKPVKHYTDAEHKNRVYHDMHTAKWWWETQLALDGEAEGGTVIPILISSDKTTLTTFGGKSAYPIYMTIGNIPKELRRKPSCHAQILLGYLPIASFEHVPTASRRRTRTNLFHYCVNFILSPLQEAGENGINLQSGDNVWRRCHPIFATFVGDYPEQLLVTCIKTGECPLCTAKRKDIGSSLHHAPYRDLETISTAFDSVNSGATIFRRTCQDAGVKPVQNPFWRHLPYFNIYQSITPDVLHQLYQGVVKHLVSWLRKAYGDAEIDARCRRLPPNHQLRQFLKGITNLSRVTGKEHAQISRILLGIIIDAKPLQPHTTRRAKDLVHAIRNFLDFLFHVQYPIHTTTTLRDLLTDLNDFHKHKEVFIQLGIRKNFNIPKLHSLEHYFDMIQFYGTTDNYNTEYTERLHIDFAKEAFRSTNMKDEFPQMTLWLERREKTFEHEQLIHHHLARPASLSVRPPSLQQPWRLTMTKRPTVNHVLVEDLVSKYKATHFEQALSRFIFARQHPLYSWRRVEQEAHEIVLPDVPYPVYHYIKFVVDHHLKSETVDIIHAKPARSDKRGRMIPPRFDTALLSQSGNNRPRDYQVVQVHAIFTLPMSIVSEFLADDPDFGIPDNLSSSNTSIEEDRSPIHLAYVDMFTKFGTVNDVHSLYQIKRLVKDSEQVSRIVPISYLHRSVHLFPKFGPRADPSWTSSNVLDRCEHFFVNEFSDRNMYVLLNSD